MTHWRIVVDRAVTWCQNPGLTRSTGLSDSFCDAHYNDRPARAWQTALEGLTQ